MGRDRHGPPPRLTEEELRRWYQWRKFTWLPGDIVITKRGDGKKPKRREDEEGRDTGQPGGTESR